MVISRKRKRSSLRATSAEDYGEVDPPPFAPAQLSLYKAYRGPLSRSLTSGLSPLILNLMLMAGQRLKARDFAAAAAVLPALLKRYRKVKTHRWYFSREIAATGAEVLRRSGGQYAQLLDDFLAHVSQDGHLSSKSGLEAYALRTRDCVLLERAMELVAAGDLNTAYQCVSEQINDFTESALVQGYLGVIALALSAREADPSFMLRTAAVSLSTAAALEPKAYFYTYYSAAAAIAGGDSDHALRLLRDFVSTKHRSDPIALYGLLSFLGTVSERDTSHIRQERIDVARRLLVTDPISKPALDIIREAYAWMWHVCPGVDVNEIADALASRIEHGDSANVAIWTELGHVLYKAELASQAQFWSASARSQWWPSHFFRVSRLNADIANDPRLVSVKGALSKMLMSPKRCPYAEAVEASGLVDLHRFGKE